MEDYKRMAKAKHEERLRRRRQEEYQKSLKEHKEKALEKYRSILRKAKLNSADEKTCMAAWVWHPECDRIQNAFQVSVADDDGHYAVIDLRNPEVRKRYFGRHPLLRQMWTILNPQKNITVLDYCNVSKPVKIHNDSTNFQSRTGMYYVIVGLDVWSSWTSLLGETPQEFFAVQVTKLGENSRSKSAIVWHPDRKTKTDSQTIWVSKSLADTLCLQYSDWVTVSPVHIAPLKYQEKKRPNVELSILKAAIPDDVDDISLQRALEKALEVVVVLNTYQRLNVCIHNHSLPYTVTGLWDNQERPVSQLNIYKQTVKFDIRVIQSNFMSDESIDR